MEASPLSFAASSRYSAIRVGRRVDEIFGVGALKHQHLERLVGFGSLDKGDEIADQLGAEEIHGRGVDLGEENRPVDEHGDGLERPDIPCH